MVNGIRHPSTTTTFRGLNDMKREDDVAVRDTTRLILLAEYISIKKQVRINQFTVDIRGNPRK